MNFSSYIVVFFGFISCVYAQSTALPDPTTIPTGEVKCYQCNSANNGESDCDSSDKNALKKFIKDCPKNQGFEYAGEKATSCRKILQEVASKSSIIRECAYTGNKTVDGKRRTGSKGATLTTYQCFNNKTQGNEEPCNSSADFKITFFAQLASFSLFVLASELQFVKFH